MALITLRRPIVLLAVATAAEEMEGTRTAQRIAFWVTVRATLQFFMVAHLTINEHLVFFMVEVDIANTAM